MIYPNGVIVEFDLTVCEDLSPELAAFAHSMHLTGMTSGLLMAAQAMAESIHATKHIRDGDDFKEAFGNAFALRFKKINEQMKAKMKP